MRVALLVHIGAAARLCAGSDVLVGQRGVPWCAAPLPRRTAVDGRIGGAFAVAPGGAAGSTYGAGTVARIVAAGVVARKLARQCSVALRNAKLREERFVLIRETSNGSVRQAAACAVDPMWCRRPRRAARKRNASRKHAKRAGRARRRARSRRRGGGGKRAASRGGQRARASRTNGSSVLRSSSEANGAIVANLPYTFRRAQVYAAFAARQRHRRGWADEAWAQILPRDRDEDVEVGEVGDGPVSHASSAAEVDVMSLKLKLLFLCEHTCKEMVRCERFEAWLDSAYGFPAEQWDAENRRRVGGSPRRPRFGRRGKAERFAEAASAQVAALIDSSWVSERPKGLIRTNRKIKLTHVH